MVAELDDLGRPRRGSWLATWSGARFWPLDPRIEDINFDDIVSGLSKECRYGKQIREFYSVAEHSVIVSLYVEKAWLDATGDPEGARIAGLHGLLHDAAEAYLGDVPHPLKIQSEMDWYRVLEDQWMDVIGEKFGLAWNEPLSQLVLTVDRRLRVDEIDALTIDPDLWVRHRIDYTKLKALGAHIEALAPERAAQVFVARFSELFRGTL